MGVYWSFFLIPFIIKIICQEKKIVRILIVDVFFFLLLMALVLRSESVGTDIPQYKWYFIGANKVPLTNLFMSDLEPLFYGMNLLVARITQNYKVFMALIAVLTILPLWKLYRKETVYPLLTISMIFTIMPYHMFFSGIRQGLAIALGVPAYFFVKRRQARYFFLVVILAMCIHKSALVLALMYPLYYLRIDKRGIMKLTPVLIVVAFFNEYIYKCVFAIIGGGYSGKYSSNTTSTGAYGMLILLSLFVVYSFYIPDNKQMTPELRGQRNFLLLCFVIQLFAPISFMVMRFGYYYHIFIPLLIPNIAKIAGEGKKNIARISIPTMYLVFAVKFFYEAYTSPTYNMFPYIPFWKG